ncbi:hypothetical protein [Amycolatopsis sp. NPDC004079]|uniref:hypothetical protein n=1 Tax=Amycolatopsis sp. NPDC004079 TaxID=3154549 RepID=UPI0033B82EFF
MTGPTIPMPGRLRAALALAFLQVLMNGVLAASAQLQIATQRSDGEEPFSLLYAMTCLWYVFAAGLMVSWIAILFGYDWGRWSLLAFEALSTIGGLAGGSLTAAAGLVLAGLVVTALFREPVTAWFAAKAAQRRASSTI